MYFIYVCVIILTFGYIIVVCSFSWEWKLRFCWDFQIHNGSRPFFITLVLCNQHWVLQVGCLTITSINKKCWVWLENNIMEILFCLNYPAFMTLLIFISVTWWSKPKLNWKLLLLLYNVAVSFPGNISMIRITTGKRKTMLNVE